MDSARLLTSARRIAQLSKVRLAQRAGTSPAALAAYETGRRSPTVATLNRVLAACGLQVRGELEPLHAHVDEVVDEMLAGPPAPLSWTTLSVIRALAATELAFALDGRSALAAHGLAAEPSAIPEVAAQDGAVLRTVLNDLWARAHDRDGLAIVEDWHDLDVRRLGPRPVLTRAGYLQLRVVADLPAPVRVELAIEPELLAAGDPATVTCPVLSVLDVEQAHPALADVLGRLRERRTVSV